MKRFAALIIVCLLLIIGPTTGCNQSKAKEVTFDQLFSNLSEYNDKDITIEGFYFQGFEIIVLSERLEYSGFEVGHLVPKGRMIWVSGGIPKEVYDKLNQQQMMGPVERYGKVRITGKFEYGGKYGHIGGYDQQITPTATTILPWSPPASEIPKGEGFAIYLLAQDVPVSQMPVLSHFELADKPFLSLGDIVSYTREANEIELTTNAMEKLLSLQVPVSGKAFVVCVDRQPIYWGAFWTPISSISFDGVTIWKPLSSQDPKVIKLELGYPSSSFYGGEDPRNSAEVMKSLEQAGKLTTMPSATTVEKLPHSMKGYELYSWPEDSQWHFTLITGTNRNKTLEEIVSNANTISEDGWVHIHVIGIDAIKTVLSRLPQNEFILWLARLRSEPTPPGGVDITLPTGPTIDTIKEYARGCGLDFMVQTP